MWKGNRMSLACVLSQLSARPTISSLIQNPFLGLSFSVSSYLYFSQQRHNQRNNQLFELGKKKKPKSDDLGFCISTILGFKTSHRWLLRQFYIKKASIFADLKIECWY